MHDEAPQKGGKHAHAKGGRGRAKGGRGGSSVARQRSRPDSSTHQVHDRGVQVLKFEHRQQNAGAVLHRVGGGQQRRLRDDKQ